MRIDGGRAARHGTYHTTRGDTQDTSRTVGYFFGADSIASNELLRCSLVFVIRSTSS